MKNEQSQQPLSGTCRSPDPFFQTDTIGIDTRQAQPTCLPAEEVLPSWRRRWWFYEVVSSPQRQALSLLITASGCFIALHWVLLSSLRCDYERRGGRSGPRMMIINDDDNSDTMINKCNYCVYQSSCGCGGGVVYSTVV